MPNPNQQQSIDSIRELLVANLTEKEQRLHDLKMEVVAAQFHFETAANALRSFDAGISAALNPPPYTPTPEEKAAGKMMSEVLGRGRTELVVKAITTFSYQPFTPDQLHQKVIELDRNEAMNLTPHVADVTRVLSRLLLSRSFRLERCSRGAGRKSPTYRQLPDLIPAASA